MSWQFKERVELFLGRVFKMSPAPNLVHQTISFNLTRAFGQLLNTSECKLIYAPFDVRLPVTNKKGNADTVVQPDIVVICDLTKLDKQGCNGAPNLVVEILSPGNSRKEMKDKFELYEQSLVEEYWIVDPVHEDVTIYTLNAKKKYIGSKPYVAGEIIKSDVMIGLELDVSEIFLQ